MTLIVDHRLKVFVLAAVLLITAMLGGVVSVNVGHCGADCAPATHIGAQAGDMAVSHDRPQR
ncbi:hypothetical protein [Mycobacterium hubeiense]|uniref:hypothetical protein n=1 Tax=Mycobacterium hubeiense TaxID=1867256 RepID=UPI000C7E9458|nr:hypothetical protein [Mycobacterium sp. QGD 101]